MPRHQRQQSFSSGTSRSRPPLEAEPQKVADGPTLAIRARSRTATDKNLHAHNIGFSTWVLDARHSACRNPDGPPLHGHHAVDGVAGAPRVLTEQHVSGAGAVQVCG